MVVAPHWRTEMARAELLRRVLHQTLLLPPHGEQGIQVGIECLFPLQRIQCFLENLVDTSVVSISQQMLHRVGEVLIKVLGKGRAWIVGQDANEHDRIVLDMWCLVVLLGQEFADL